MILDRLGKELLFFDGGMGTLLQARGLKAGETPEEWNLSKKEDITDIHRLYIDAGSDMILSNTFGANPLKLSGTGLKTDEVVKCALDNAKRAAKEAGPNREIYVGLDVGPTGKLLEPIGDLSFEDCYQAFREVVIPGERYGADFIHVETMSDTYEIKAAVLAAKENTSLPVFATMVFDERGRLLTGGDIGAMAALLDGLRVDALGINCGLGPSQMLPLLEELRTYTPRPIIVKPNAGLPVQRNGNTCYDVDEKQFADLMYEIWKKGAAVIGGCCGTTPSHIAAMTARFKGNRAVAERPDHWKSCTLISSYGKSVRLDADPVIIGERINPTGKKRFKQALVEKDTDFILQEAIRQQDVGAHILDVNLGLPDINEAEMMRQMVPEIQGITNLPIQIDTVDIKAMEAALRIYNGKPMINSVSGKKESMDAVFPLISRYGGVVVGLTLDERGIPPTAEERVEIAGRIIKEAEKYGIHKRDIVIDVLAMTISAEKEGAVVTLEALRKVREKYGVCTVLGISNISFGLPMRSLINSSFYTMAMYSGLSAGIINPMSEEMMNAYYAYRALMGVDDNCTDYIKQCGGQNEKTTAVSPGTTGLKQAIIRGMKEDARAGAKNLLKEKDALTIIHDEMMPALDVVGKDFEKGTLFLPQLLKSADAAKAAFEEIKAELARRGRDQKKGEKVILATVKGDVHDIGKNIVKVLLENYSYDVIDLGKDVPPEVIVERAKKDNVKLVGLSALMTTTVASMAETIRMLRREMPDCRIMVGGAVMNQDYSDQIGADFYGRDAMQSVYYTQKLFAKEN